MLVRYENSKAFLRICKKIFEGIRLKWKNKKDIKRFVPPVISPPGTDQTDLTSRQIRHLNMTFIRVEAAFRSLKTDLGTRPIYHQLAGRTEARIFILILVYHLLTAIDYQLSSDGDVRCWKTIRSVLGTLAGIQLSLLTIKT